MKKNSLKEIADELKQKFTTTNQPAKIALCRGLCLAWGGDQLTLSRKGVIPSAEEIAICQQAFGVSGWHFKNGQAGEWYMVRLRRPAEQLTMPIGGQPGQPAPVYY